MNQAQAPSQEQVERAILVGVDTGDEVWPLEDSLAELERLAETDGVEVVAKTSQRIEERNPRTLIGKGKVEELVRLSGHYNADVVIFDEELTPSQQNNLEGELGKSVRVIDRTALILDIFALHATTREGRLQVQLAQNQYLYPRLRGMWAHLEANRMGGGVGSRFGEGESQLEVDRRLVRKRIDRIRRELKKVSQNRQTQRKGRSESGIFRVSLAGYTNAGKSSLLNALTGADVESFDKLFATLESTTRRLELPKGYILTLTDTVGFIQKLPHTLVEAFQSTLEEIVESDLILEVVDASNKRYAAQMQAVGEVLGEIGAERIPTLQVFNKVDLLDDDDLEHLRRLYPDAIYVSAETGEGLDGLLERLETFLEENNPSRRVLIPYAQGRLVELAHERASIIEERYTEDGTYLELRARPEVLAAFEPYAVEEVAARRSGRAR
ncbi:MAG: GTPase HflX [Coriobacteriaceae bacterium]|nr:GTPase HflX [Coriobacteriaceae bacterium]